MRPFMATPLPQSRNPNLPQPPPAAAEVHRHLKPPPDAPEEPGRGATALRSFIAMLVVGGLIATGIWFYLRGSDENMKQRELIFADLTAIGAGVWDSRGFVAPPAEGEERNKDLADLPRIFTAARTGAEKNNIKPRIVPVEGDPPPGNGNASHQINFFFGDNLGIILRVRYDDKSETFSFIGVHNRIVPSRQVMEEDAARSGTPAPVETAPASALPAAAPPAEKVSEPPANPP